ncbi:unnamed protein product [Agarophyton chilense]|eukprot:gb/GEZJ01003176.1/.p1 GENE.gb/GEZJ01003176.1/~~gb/GEZJ01003176.1/.p1  ORF type:complete len:1715 (-),score=205.30 gb/GEZJ01003176.1/:760-5904(-)
MATSASKPPRLTETASMILSWLRTAVPSILHNAGHPTTRPANERPAQALAAVLSDAVVLADILSFLDPMRLPPAAVMRSTARAAMSSPLPVSPTESIANIDARQRHVQYRNNTRRVVDALKNMLPDVRRHALVAHHPPPGAVDTYAPRVADTLPETDIWPALHLAQLVIACAVYGPRHHHFRHSLWRFPTEIVRTTFHASMASVARAVCLPPPEVLYKAGPPPSPTVMSPHALPPPMAHYSPHLSPLPLQPMSPSCTSSSAHMLSPAYIATPQPLVASHALPTPPSPHYAYSPRTPVHGPPFSPQHYAAAPPPHVSSSMPISPTPHRPPPPLAAPARPTNASSRADAHFKSVTTTTTASRAGSSARNPSTHSQPLVRIAERNVPDAPASPLDATALHLSTEDGIGVRKFSLVTQDSGTRSREISPLPAFQGSFSNVQSRSTASEFDDFRNMSAVTEQGESVGVADMSKSSPLQAQSAPADTTAVDCENQSGGKSSDEFFTPNESLSETDSQRQSVVSHEFFAITASVPSGAPPAIETSEHYSESKVDEVVRKAISTSITQQTSRPQLLLPTVSSNSVDHGAERDDDARLNRDSTRTSSFDFTNPALNLSPAFADAPSPFNQWQVPRSKAMGHDILSPQTLFSPPKMPTRLGRATARAQVAPRPAPKLFRSGSSSPQLSVSSTGTRSYGGAEGGSSAPKRPGTSDSSKRGAGPSRPSSNSSGSRRSGSLERQPRAEVEAEPLVSAMKSTSSFSLPPSTSESSDHRRGSSKSSSPVPTLVRDSRESDLGDENDSLLGRDPMATPQNVQLEPLDDEFDISAFEEALSDRALFQRVEEVLVKTTDYRASQAAMSPDTGSDTNITFDEMGYPERRPIRTRERRQASRGSSATQSPIPSSRHSPVPSPKTPIRTARTSGTNPPASQPKPAKARPSAVVSAASSTVATPEIKPSAALPPLGPDVSSPAIRPSSRKPPMYSTPVIPTERRRGVPPTPPSPPSIESLIKKFSDQTPPPESVDSGSRPISTMEPSAGLFQKLISVWQNSDEEGREHGSVRSNILDGGLTPKSMLLQPSGSGSQESTLPSGDTELGLGRGSASTDSSRGRRPRGVRLPDKPHHISVENLLSPDEEIHSKLQELREGTSVASYGDSYPDDKEKSWVEEARASVECSREGILGGETSATHLLSRSGSVNQASSSIEGSRRITQDAKEGTATASGTESSQVHTGSTAINTDGHHVRVDKRRLDWLTRELLAARDSISRKELQMTFAETQRVEQQEILLLEKQDAESVVEAMKRILAEREEELKEARNRLSTTIQNVSTQDRSSLASKTSMGGAGENLGQLIRDGHAKLQTRIGEAELKQQKGTDLISNEMQSLWSEVQRAMLEKMVEMTEKRDMELELLRKELESREMQVQNLQVTSSQLVERNRECEAEASEMRLENLKSTHRYELEMSHVTAQVELVNEFSKKLHDNFRETENLRQQVLHYQDKLSHITSTTGVSQRQIKELREAVTRANDECARLRREAELAKKKGWEAIRRAEELEDLRIKDEAAQVAGRYPERRDGSESGSYRSSEAGRAPRHHGGPGGRYHGLNRTRGAVSSPTPAQKAWLVIKDKIGGIVANRDMGASRRRGHLNPARRDASRTATGSQTSQTRSRNSNRDEDVISRSTRSRTSNGSGSSARGGTPRSNTRRTPPSQGSNPYMHSSPHSRGEGQSIRAVGF